MKNEEKCNKAESIVDIFEQYLEEKGFIPEEDPNDEHIIFGEERKEMIQEIITWL